MNRTFQSVVKAHCGPLLGGLLHEQDISVCGKGSLWAFIEWIVCVKQSSRLW